MNRVQNAQQSGRKKNPQRQNSSLHSNSNLQLWFLPVLKEELNHLFGFVSLLYFSSVGMYETIPIGGITFDLQLFLLYKNLCSMTTISNNWFVLSSTILLQLGFYFHSFLHLFYRLWKHCTCPTLVLKVEICDITEGTVQQVLKPTVKVICHLNGYSLFWICLDVWSS